MQKPTSAVLSHIPQIYRVIHTFFNRTCCHVNPLRITITLSYFLFTFFRYTKSLKFSAVCKLKCNPISVRWYNTNKSSTLLTQTFLLAKRQNLCCYLLLIMMVVRTCLYLQHLGLRITSQICAKSLSSKLSKWMPNSTQETSLPS